MIILIETERLRLAPVAAADVDLLLDLWSDPGLVNVLEGSEALSRARVEQIVYESGEAHQASRYGLWVASLSSGALNLGFCGHWPVADHPDPHLVCGVRQGLRGRGLATEMVSAILRQGFGEYGLGAVRMRIDPRDPAASGLSRSLGMALAPEEPRGDLAREDFILRREDFRARHRRHRVDRLGPALTLRP